MTDGLSFSKRMGLEPIKEIIQIDSMDSDLRVGLWNCLYKSYFKKAPDFVEESQPLTALTQSIWFNFYKLAIDEIPEFWLDCLEFIRENYFKSKWNKVYDFIQFVANNYKPDGTNLYFIDQCNSVMAKEVSGYRFIDRVISPLTSEIEIAEIEQALKNTDALKPVHLHLQDALRKFSDRESPDYRNSIKESISAVEAISKIIAKKDKASLAGALDVVKANIHPSLKTGFKKIYAWTSDDEGIRHALMDIPTLDSEDANFMLVSCSAFVNYLIVKANKAGINLT